MPNPNLYKTEKEFMQDCMHITKQEGLTMEQGLGKCINMWKNRKKKMARNVISRLPAPQYSRDRLEDLLKYCQDRLEREGKPLNRDTLEKTIILIKEDLKNQKTSSDILTCPDCGYDLDNTKGMDPTKNLIKCPQCGEFSITKSHEH